MIIQYGHQSVDTETCTDAEHKRLLDRIRRDSERLGEAQADPYVPKRHWQRVLTRRQRR